MIQKATIDGKYEYFAFISYKEEDAQWAKWLQHKLEHYKLSTVLRRENPDLPERISPIYEYKSEASGGRLKEVLWKGLTSSKFLIVICSPRATKSDWLNNGIRYFVESGQEENIIPFIIEGKPKAEDPKEECFPAELSKLTGDRELRGININEMGRDAAAVKVVAQMMEIKFDALWQRHQKEKTRRTAIYSASIMILAAIILSSLWIWQKNHQLQQSNWKIMEVQSRFIAEKINTLINEGDAYTATMLALETLPLNLEKAERPYVSESEYALRQVLACNSALLKLPEGKLNSVSFSPNGGLALAKTEVGQIIAWDIKTGALLDTIVSFPTDTMLHKIGAMDIFKVNDNQIRILNHNLNMWQQSWGNSKDSVSCVAISPDGNVIATVSKDLFLRIRDAHNGVIIDSVKAHSDIIRSVSFSPDGQHLATASANGIVKVWNRTLHHPPVILSGHGRFKVYSAQFSPNGKTIVTASEDKTLKIWDVATGKCQGIMAGHQGEVRNVCFSPDGKYVASASYDKEAWIWDVNTLKPVKKLQGHTSSVCSVCFSPDVQQLLTASWDNTIKIWNLATGSVIKEWEAHHRGIHSAVFSPNGQNVISASWENNAKIWNASTGRIIHELKGHDKMVTSVSFFPDGNHIITSSADGTIKIWNFPPLQHLIDQTHELFKNRQLTQNERREYYLE